MFKTSAHSDGASTNRTSSERADEESGEVYRTVEAVMSFKKQDQLQRHRNSSPKRLRTEMRLWADSRTVIIQEESHSE